MENNNTPATNGKLSATSPAATSPEHWTLDIHPSTGGQFRIEVPCNETVEGLKKKLAKRLKAPKEKLMLLFKDRQLRDGTLESNALSDGCRLVLLPAVESGLLSHRHDPGLLQAVENLTDEQINEFLSGRSPLTLALRLGDHMVFVQLQLASAVGKGQNKTCCKSLNAQHIAPCQKQQQQQQPSTSKSPQPLQAQSCHRHGHQSTSSPRTSSTTSPPASPVLPPSPSQPQSPPPSPVQVAPVQSTSGIAPSSSPHSCKSQTRPSRAPGAVIESVKQHAPGIFSGTFSGSLSPAVQDRNGRPKRDLNTIMHILNDLLAAAPMYKHHHAQAAVAAATTNGPQRIPPPAAAATHKVQATHHHHHNHQQQHQHHHHHHHHHHHQHHHHHNRRPKSMDEKMRLHQENCHTRSKMEQLQTMMRARQMRRKARREMRAPWADTRNVAIPDGLETSGNGSVTMETALEKTLPENCFTDLKQEYVFA